MFTVLRKKFLALVHHNEDLRLLEFFKPLYYIVLTFGLFPHSVDFIYDQKYLTVVFKSATISLACNFLMPVVICIFFALYMLELDGASENFIFGESWMTKIYFNSEIILEALVCTTIYVCAFKNRSLYINVLNEMTDCWTKFPKSVGNKILRQQRSKMYGVVLGSVLLVPILECPLIYTERVPIWEKILGFINFIVPELIQFTSIAFYLVMIMMIVALLKNIEEHVKIVYHTKSLWSASNVAEELEPLPASLRQLRSVYARAQAAKRQVNAAFQAPLLLILAQSFHALVTEAHALYHGLFFEEEFNIRFVLDCCFWIILQIIKIYTLSHSGAILKQQVAEIGRALHNIPTDIDEDVTLYLEIQHFTTLMKFQGAEIVVFGYFSLESSLIFNVIASATTYLVILVQFDST